MHQRKLSFRCHIFILYLATLSISPAKKDTLRWKIRWKVKWFIAFYMHASNDNLLRSPRQKSSEVWNLKPGSKNCYSFVIVNKNCADSVLDAWVKFHFVLLLTKYFDSSLSYRIWMLLAYNAPSFVFLKTILLWFKYFIHLLYFLFTNLFAMKFTPLLYGLFNILLHLFITQQNCIR
jgi:hypothetical protein